MTVMRKLTLLLLCLALGIGVCDAKKKNRGVYFRTDAEIVLDKPYFGLNVSNMIQVVLEADRNPASVRVETENVPAEAVSVRVRRGELVLACDPGALSSKRKNDMSKRVVVYVGAAPLESCSLSGMSSVFSETEIDKPSVTVECMGMSEFESNIRCRSLTMSVSGMSIYKGQVVCEDTATVEASGMSQAVADFMCRDLDCTLTGMSVYNGNVNCRQKAEVAVDGSSECTFSGTARDLMLEVSGMSQFKGRKFLASGLADCDISGMSTASVAAAGSLKYCVSGMSEFNYSGEPVVISTSVDNATVRHR